MIDQDPPSIELTASQGGAADETVGHEFVDAQTQRPSRGTSVQKKSASLRWVILLGLWVPLIFTLALVVLAMAGQHIRDKDTKWILHTVEVKAQLESLFSLLKDIETSERGYLLTEEPTFLEPYQQALKEIPGQNEHLAHLIEDNPKQVEAAKNLRALIVEKLATTEQLLSLAQEANPSDAISILKEGQGRRSMDQIRSQISAMMAEEDHLLAEREETLATQISSTKIEMVGLVAVELVLIMALTLLMQRSRNLQSSIEVRIEEAHAMTDHAQETTLKAMGRTERAEVRVGEANVRTEQAEATTALLYTCVSHLNDIVLITEADSLEEPGPRIVFVNDAFERMTGYTSTEALGKSPRFLQGEKTDRSVLSQIHEAVAQRKPIRRQIINYRKDGTEFWLDIDIVPILDATGKCTHFAGIERDITESKQAELALRESESRYASLFTNMLGGYAYCRILFEQGRAVDLIYLEVNNAFEGLTGLKNVVGKKISEVIPDVQETNPELLEMYGRVALTGQPEKSERYLKSLGIWFSISVYSDKAEHISAVFENITERKRNESRYSRLVHSNAQGVIFWNSQGDISGANDAFLRLLRYTRQDLEDGLIKWLELTPPEFAHLDRRALEQIAATGACTPYEKEFIRKDGVRVPVLMGGTNFEDSPLEGVAFVLDLTERKCAVEQIAEQAALLDEAQDAIIVRDLAGKAIYWNKGAERMYGWTRQEVLGRNMSELLFVTPKKFNEINELTVTSGKWSGNLQHLTKDKREIAIESRWTLIRDNVGRPKSILAINTDVTDEKKIEAQFMRAQRMESIGTLAGGIAHDLNNILAPIMMSIDILKLMATDPQMTSILNTIDVSSKRGADIVRQVLSFARGMEGQRVEIQSAQLLKDLKSTIKDTFPKNIRLEFSIPNDTWMIVGDPTQVHQILLNLCVNARDAMPNGGHLTISVENCVLDEHYAAMHHEAKAGRYIKINVTDTGTGIPKGIIDKIFDPFFTTKEINEGTGLGLSTVMAIVKSHHGIIDVYSEPGKGTTFKVYLPAMELSPEAQKLITQEISIPRGKGELILIVDDEASILTITSQTLQAFGYRVITADDGAEAVAAYAIHRKEIAVVLTDMSMPIMDGTALIRALTKINPTIKIIAASGLNANGTSAIVSGISANHFLTKPYTAGALLKTMRTILDEV